MDNDEVVYNPDFMRLNNLTAGYAESGLIDKMLTKSNSLYKSIKSDKIRKSTSPSGNLRYTYHRDGNKSVFTTEQLNIGPILEEVKATRARQEQGDAHPGCPLDPKVHGKMSQYAIWVLPRVIIKEIETQYFGGLPFDNIKYDLRLKAQWFKVINRDYPYLISYPGGVLPIPSHLQNVPFPGKLGERKYFGEKHGG